MRPKIWKSILVAPKTSCHSGIHNRWKVSLSPQLLSLMMSRATAEVDVTFLQNNRAKDSVAWENFGVTQSLLVSPFCSEWSSPWLFGISSIKPDQQKIYTSAAHVPPFSIFGRKHKSPCCFLGREK